MSYLVGHFIAVGTLGKRYLVNIFEGQTPTTHLTSEERSSKPGLRSFKLQDGGRVNQVDDDTFEIMETGERIKRE